MNAGLHWPEKFIEGYSVENFPLDPKVRKWIENENWNAIDKEFQTLTAPTGDLYQFLKKYHDFDSIEFIISIRDAFDEWQEDGIWHDDGSRLFAFSLSLTLDQIEGGDLGLRRVGSETFVSVPTPAYSEAILFLTGHYGFEHKIHRVTRGRRIMLVGWCSKQE